MKSVINFINAGQPCGNVFPGGMAILCGDAPVWQYCMEFHKAVMEGAAVIAIAHGIDTKTNGKGAVVAYSIDPDYRVGNTIEQDDLLALQKRRRQHERSLLFMDNPVLHHQTCECFVKKYGDTEGQRRFFDGEDLPSDDVPTANSEEAM